MQSAEVFKCVFSLGVSPRHKGFGYICSALELMRGGMEYHAAMERLSNEKGLPVRSAERCMRYAVRCAWDEHPGAIRGVFLLAEQNARFAPPPAITEFLSVALWRIGSA